MKYVLIILLVAIVVSLAEAMYFLARDSGERDRKRVVRALTVRVGLSLLLFVLAIAAAVFGLLDPHGVRP